MKKAVNFRTEFRSWDEGTCWLATTETRGYAGSHVFFSSLQPSAWEAFWQTLGQFAFMLKKRKLR